MNASPEMTNRILDQLATLIVRDGQILLARWRSQVRQIPCARKLDIPALNDHIPQLLDELVDALTSNSDETILDVEGGASAPSHGLQRLRDAFDIEEIVAEYNLLRCCIHELAEDHGLNLQGRPLRILNREIDRAIGSALATYMTQSALEIQRRRQEYLAFVAHDLRTPLNAIALAGRVLELAFPANKSEAIAQMFKALRRNVQHLDTLVNTVLEENSNLNTETGIKLERRELDLWPFVEAMIHDLHPVAGTASARLINRVPEELVIYADARLLKRVLQNLIANAIKYTPRGEIVIEAQEFGDEGEVSCWVADNGAGIPKDLLDKVFDSGEGDPDYEGATGLGLAIVKMFTEAHGGRVSAESQEGVGSTFRFTVPGKAK